MIGIIIPTFLRDKCLFDCLDSIQKYWIDDYYVIIVDQGKFTKEKTDFVQRFLNKCQGEYIPTEFDIGALKARNIAIKKCKELNIPYILMFADSMRLIKQYDFSQVIEFLNTDKANFLCGFNKTNSICTWECDMKKTNCFELDIPRRPKINYRGLEFQRVDICRNIFLCKTEMLYSSMYDEDRKMADHEPSFYRWQQLGYKCYYLDSFLFDYTRDRNPVYKPYRDRFFQFRNQMLQKYNLTSWVKYSPDLKKKWDNERHNKL